MIILAALIAVIVLYAVTGGELSSEAEGSGGEGSGECSMVVEADSLNVRSGPSTGDPIVDSLAEGAETDATDEVQVGFRKLDEGRWASDDFLEPADGASC
ncbi:hypothetical protein BJF85_15095 [Saccharomonospora sp. CUA-673]|uniref:SH3 domain-containing protein n=1 Tax=Saccharomonospora sp. CUA-673 TaxID=1904969 RepID=UPI000964AB91|nr:SH3 domain-containing protein [Saccharomonospora sp. CUA-673]OLT47711.1 hypothetical protein BJF85_15095 [Saccharomonospora sp. CUA-673]